jgi:hypothetical protein
MNPEMKTSVKHKMEMKTDKEQLDLLKRAKSILDAGYSITLTEKRCKAEMKVLRKLALKHHFELEKPRLVRR